MRFCKLRIAFSAVCGIICLLLIALWVRSYWREDDLRVPLPKTHTLRVDSFRGRIVWDIYTLPHLHQWELLISFPQGEWDDDPAYPWYWIPMGTPTPEALVVSHWFPSVVTAILAAVPWIKWRFGLRTLLVVTTLVAVALGAIVIAARK